MALIFDERWKGNFGIGRFSIEVRERTSMTGIENYRSHRSPLSAMEAVRLWHTLRQQRDAVFFSPAFAGTFPGAAKQVLTVWDLTHLKKSNKSIAKVGYYTAIVAPAIRRAGVVLTGTTSSRNDLQNWLNDDSIEIAVVGCGISDVFQPDPLSVPRRRTVLIVSTLLPHKNTLTVLKAIAAMKRDVSAVWVTNDYSAAKAVLDALGLSSRVEIRSSVSDADLSALYNGSSCLAFPSRHEGFGLPPVEALACGLPVVYAKECAAVDSNIRDFGGTYAVQEAISVAEWVETIEIALAAPRPTFELERSNFSWDSVAARVDDVLGRHSGGPSRLQ